MNRKRQRFDAPAAYKRATAIADDDDGCYTDCGVTPTAIASHQASSIHSRAMVSASYREYLCSGNQKTNNTGHQMQTDV